MRMPGAWIEHTNVSVPGASSFALYSPAVFDGEASGCGPERSVT